MSFKLDTYNRSWSKIGCILRNLSLFCKHYWSVPIFKVLKIKHNLGDWDCIFEVFMVSYVF